MSGHPLHPLALGWGTWAVGNGMTPTLALGLLALTLGMCAISAVSAIFKVTKIDPAVVFTR